MLEGSCVRWPGEAKPSGKKQGDSLDLRQKASYQAGKEVAPDGCPMPRESVLGASSVTVAPQGVCKAIPWGAGRKENLYLPFILVFNSFKLYLSIF